MSKLLKFITGCFHTLHFGYDAGDGKGSLQRSTLWVGEDGTLNLQPAQDGTGARMILYPHNLTEVQTKRFLAAHVKRKTKGGPEIGATAELTIYGESDQGENHPEENFERFSMTQMNKNERNVRFSMERGGTGEFRELWFGFDTWKPGLAYFPLRICPGTKDRKAGVYVVDAAGEYKRIGG